MSSSADVAREFCHLYHPELAGPALWDRPRVELTHSPPFSRLLAPQNPILRRLGARFPFEIAVGMNGRVWVKAAQAEGDEDQLVAMIRELRGDEEQRD